MVLQRGLRLAANRIGIAGKPSDLYGKGFQRSIGTGSARSAERVVPLAIELLRPQSVIDVGCGVGAWLAEFKRLGVARVVGLDLDDSCVRNYLDQDEFFVHDFSQPLPSLLSGFDLALSLEVAEHLPETQADAFVAQLTTLAPAVLFSAAVPHQGGTGHINEQWPEYWARRFVDHGLVAVDCFRPAIWNDPDVEFWYAQNLILYVHPSVLARNDSLQRDAAATNPDTLSRVHPRLYLANVRRPFGPSAKKFPIIDRGVGFARMVLRSLGARLRLTNRGQ